MSRASSFPFRSLLPFVAIPLAAAALHAQSVGYENRILVRPTPDASRSALRACYRTAGVRVFDSVTIGPMRVVALVSDGSSGSRESAIAALSHSGLFEWVVADTVVADITAEPSRALDPVTLKEGRLPQSSNPANVPDDSLFSEQWGLYNPGTFPGSTPGADIDLLDAWAITRGNSNIVVAVGEEGVQADHPDLVGQFVGDNDEIDAINNNNQHGTRVCGIIGARAGNGIGIAGIAPDCRMTVVNSQYGTTVLGVLKALERVVQHDAAVFTNSWGFMEPARQPLQEAFDVIARSNRGGKGCLVIFASGNDYKPWVHYPSWYPRFLSVGGTSSADTRFIPADFGNELDLCAPAQTVVSCDIDGTYSLSDGTSVAAPAVAGVAALILSANPDLTADSVRAILELTCDKVGGYRYDQLREHGTWSPYTGYGRINAGRAVRMARGRLDTAQRIVWPRGNERFVPGESVLIDWHGDKGASLSVRDSAGVERTLAILIDSGSAGTLWRPDTSGLFRLFLRSSRGEALDSTGLPIRVAVPQWSVAVDTTAPFVSVHDSALRSRLRLLVPTPSIYTLPFDLSLGRDTAWTWESAAWGGSLPTGTTFQLPRRLILEPNGETTPAVVDFFSNLLTGVDSTWYAVLGQEPEQMVIIELVGLRADTTLASPAMRDAFRTMRRQIRYREADGSIQLYSNQSVDFAPVSDGTRQQATATVGLRLRDELYLPFGPIPTHLPSGSISFTPRRFVSIPTPRRTIVRSTDSRATYGYDVYRVNVITNSIDTLGMMGSRDDGRTWEQMVEIMPGKRTSSVLVPPSFGGSFLLQLVDSAGTLWRDTLQVTDPGYTIEKIERTSLSLRGDPLATTFTLSRADDGAFIKLPFTFPCGGTTFTHGILRPSGAIELSDSNGTSDVYALLSCYPRVGITDGDSIVPMRYRTIGAGPAQQFVIEWDSLSRFDPARARSGRAQMVLHIDGRIDMHLFADTGRGAHASYPSVNINEFFLAPPEFTTRENLLDSVITPMASYRFIPHTPLSEVRWIESASQSLRITPHPVSGLGRVTALDGGPLRCRVLDPSGRLVGSFETTGGSVPLPKLPAGVYLLIDDVRHTAQRFVVVQ